MLKYFARAWFSVLLMGLVVIALQLAFRSAFASAGWYVAPGGSDANDCLSPSAPCATINAAIGKAAAGDSVRAAAGIYTTAVGTAVVVIDKDLALTGGWDAAFTAQTGESIIDGEATRRGLTVSSGVTASLDRFTVRHGYHSANDNEAGGIQNNGVLTLSNSIVVDNNSFSEKGGIVNAGVMTITGSQIISNVGGIYNVGSQLRVINSFIGHNSSGGGLVGGLYNMSGTVALDNSTISRNTCGFSGCGVYNYYDGNVQLNNATVTENEGGLSGAGVANNVGALTLRNSLIADNWVRNAGKSDCAGTITSAGYNLVSTTSGCSFTASTGDRLNVKANGLLLGGSYALFAGSAAIDHGDPAGCLDHQGEVLTSDQRGRPRPVDGDGDTVARCDIGAYEFDPADPIRQVFQPMTARNYNNCPDYFDDFSNPASGWLVVEDGNVLSQYLNGEFRVYSKHSGYSYAFRAPTCSRQNYVVEVDARWEGTPGKFYGLIFGVTADFSRYYLFIVSTDYGGFALYRFDANGYNYLNGGLVPGLNNYGTPNHLKVTRNADQISVGANGYSYLTWSDGSITGLTGVGIITIPYEVTPKSDARFDNFRVTGLPITPAAR